MSRKHLITETYLGDSKEQNFYYLMLPDVSEPGFYRATTSFNAFFNSRKKPRPNVTNVRQFTACPDDEIVLRKLMFRDAGVDWDNLRVFRSIWEFYNFIKYDYKTRQYTSKEKLTR